MNGQERQPTAPHRTAPPNKAAPSVRDLWRPSSLCSSMASASCDPGTCSVLCNSRFSLTAPSSVGALCCTSVRGEERALGICLAEAAAPDCVSPDWGPQESLLETLGVWRLPVSDKAMGSFRSDSSFGVRPASGCGVEPFR